MLSQLLNAMMNNNLSSVRLEKISVVQTSAVKWVEKELSEMIGETINIQDYLSMYCCKLDIKAFWPFEMSLWELPCEYISKVYRDESVKWYSAKYFLFLERINKSDRDRLVTSLSKPPHKELPLLAAFGNTGLVFRK